MRAPFACLLMAASLLMSASKAMQPPDVTLPATGLAAAGYLEHDDCLYHGEQPFSGRLVLLDPQGRPCRAGRYQAGRLDGDAEEWYPGGGRKAVGSYRQGQRTGTLARWWPNGQRQFVGHFSGDVYDGDVQDYDVTGRLVRQAHFAAGHESGLQRIWRTDGTLFASYTVMNGRTYGLYGSISCVAR